MKIRKFRALLTVAGLSLLAAQAGAREPGVPSSVPPGNSMGVPVGANPPPGLYFSSRSGYWDAELSDNDGNYGGQTNTLIDTAFQFLWVPGKKVLGGDYKAFVTIPLLYNHQEREAPFPPPLQGSASDTALGNIEISPISLSWMVEPGIFVSAGLSVFAPTGSFDPLAPISTGGDFWTLSPSVGFSYLRDGWNASIHANYFTNTKNDTTDYTSGNEILVNFTALKDMGGFSLGPVGYYRKQLSDDVNDGIYYGGMTLENAAQTGVGLGFSKRSGPLETNINLTRDVNVRNTVGGTKIWVNVTMPIGANP